MLATLSTMAVEIRKLFELGEINTFYRVANIDNNTTTFFSLFICTKRFTIQNYLYYFETCIWLYTKHRVNTIKVHTVYIGICNTQN